MVQKGQKNNNETWEEVETVPFPIGTVDIDTPADYDALHGKLCLILKHLLKCKA
jgi:hypothetical protein